MPRYYCDYCDTYLTHDSPSVRKQHNAGYKHKANVRTYYQQFEEQQTQSLIDQRIKEHLGQTAAYQQVGAAYNQHLASLQGQRPRLPVLPTPVMPMPGTAPANAPLIPGMRPPILPRPVTGAPGYGPAPNMPSMMGPPSAMSFPMQVNVCREQLPVELLLLQLPLLLHRMDLLSFKLLRTVTSQTVMWS
ncbi:hypothetical protein NE237_014423 [Protea cynaroides]|uniref:U1 small nuclear ribonucleoprotein C n=1 Tax=Protea cynaroides TaxID=273540 RepID=A0A9Q0QQ22_9MAGN|nr:hypothetical protein NE237_014423 [Protea cynaroides]